MTDTSRTAGEQNRDLSPDRTPSLLVAAPAITAVLLLGLVLRLVYIARVSVSGDEAVFGLMSFAIARGEELPIYCWGAHYASALISYLGIVSMTIFGVTAFAFKVATLPWTAATLLLVPLALRREWGTARSVAAGALFAIVPPSVLEMSVAAHGGYPETFFLGVAVWYIALDLANRDREPAIGRMAAALLLGFLSGASFAILWLGVPFLVAALVLLATSRALVRKEFLAVLAGGLVGSLPFWIYNLWLTPGSTIRRLGGRSLAADSQTPILDALVLRIQELPRWLAESANGLAVLFEPQGGLGGLLLLLVAAGFGIRGIALSPGRRQRHWAILIIAFAIALLFFNLAGNLTRARHWTPLWIVLTFALVGIGRRAGTVALVTLCVVTLPSMIDFIRRATPDPVILDAAALVEATGADALIADYDLGYPIAFALRGRIPVAAVAPPNASDRHPYWTREVALALRPAALLPPDDADRLIPILLAAGYTFRRDDLGTRFLISITGTSGRDSRLELPSSTTGAATPSPGSLLLSHATLRGPGKSTVATPRPRP